MSERRLSRRSLTRVADLGLKLILGFQLGIVPVMTAQNMPVNRPSTTTQTTPGNNRTGRDNDPMDAPNAGMPSMSLRLEHMREEERQKRLQTDVAKLQTLTSELKAELEKASKDELSLDVVRKAAEIEKLAHDVKERMKN